jgi:hypothetical protein
VKNRMVGSWQIDTSSIPRQFFLFADAYLDSAARLCRVLKRSSRKISYPRGAVVLFLTSHAVELFLKAAILEKSPKEKLHHDVEQLDATYRVLYPEPQFVFAVPFKTEYLGFKPEEIIEKKPGIPQNQLNRYPSDRFGKNWGGLFAFDPISFLRVIEQLQCDFDRLQKYIFAAPCRYERKW